VEIAADLPFYPACNFELVGEFDVSDAAITEYPGGLHAFDNPKSPSYDVFADAQTSRSCRRREGNGRILNADTGQPFTYRDACVELGPAVQYDDGAADAAQAAVRAFVTRILRLAN
jgi:dienelactone hydrolase